MIRRKTQGGNGFTIVELLIVIVVIGVLAAVVVVAFRGVQTNANRTLAANEAKQWIKLLEMYKIKEGSLPSLANGYYCLGTGFPNGYCYEGPGAAASNVAESTGSSIITAITDAGVGKPPLNTKKWIMQGGARVGPWVQVTATEYRVSTFFNTGTTDTCAQVGITDNAWISANGRDVICSKYITRT